MTPNFLIDQGNGFEWLPFNSFEDVVEALSGLEPFKVYEVEVRSISVVTEFVLFDISERAADAWVEKNQGSIEIEDGEPFVCDFIKNNASNLDELVGEFVTSQMARERDERVLLSERL